MYISCKNGISGECHNSSLMISQHWLREWPGGAVRWNGLVPPGNEPSNGPKFTQIYVTIWGNKASMSWFTLRFAGNVAYNKSATQGPETFVDLVASQAVNGNHNPKSGAGNCIHTDDTVQPPDPGWWQVDLGSTYVVLDVNITNRDAASCKLPHTHILMHIHTHIVNAVTSLYVQNISMVLLIGLKKGRQLSI